MERLAHLFYAAIAILHSACAGFCASVIRRCRFPCRATISFSSQPTRRGASSLAAGKRPSAISRYIVLLLMLDSSTASASPAALPGLSLPAQLVV
jgi:hypothetical protein